MAVAAAKPVINPPTCAALSIFPPTKPLYREQIIINRTLGIVTFSILLSENSTIASSAPSNPKIAPLAPTEAANSLLTTFAYKETRLPPIPDRKYSTVYLTCPTSFSIIEPKKNRISMLLKR